jgi:hypothetical protein
LRGVFVVPVVDYVGVPEFVGVGFVRGVRDLRDGFGWGEDFTRF